MNEKFIERCSLFFAGGPTNLTILKLRMTMLGIAAVAAVAGLLLLLRLPAGQKGEAATPSA